MRWRAAVRRHPCGPHAPAARPSRWRSSTSSRCSARTSTRGTGLSETAPVATFNQPVYGRKPGCVGRAIWGVDVEIARADLEGAIELLPVGELGEIVIRGQHHEGLPPCPDATAAAIVDGWFRSG